MSTYCLRCKDDTKNVYPAVEEDKGRVYLKSECGTCGCLKSRLLPKGAGKKKEYEEYTDSEEDDESESEYESEEADELEEDDDDYY